MLQVIYVCNLWLYVQFMALCANHGFMVTSVPVYILSFVPIKSLKSQIIKDNSVLHKQLSPLNYLPLYLSDRDYLPSCTFSGRKHV